MPPPTPSTCLGWKAPSKRSTRSSMPSNTRPVTNLKGDLPEGYVDAGATTVAGVGKVTAKALNTAIGNAEALHRLRDLAAEMAAIWGALSAIEDHHRRQELVERYGKTLVQAGNRYGSLLEDLGLKGPYAGS